MSVTKFGGLVVGEGFKLPGSTVLLIKDTLRAEPTSGWIDASCCGPNQPQPCHFPYNAQVVRYRSNQGNKIWLKSQLLRYQCVICQNRKEGVANG